MQKVTTFKREGGYMPAGNDVHSAQMTIANAKVYAEARPEILGFTFSGPPGEPPSDVALPIHFKSSASWAPGSVPVIKRDCRVSACTFCPSPRRLPPAAKIHPS
jgi:hypothetical protein